MTLCVSIVISHKFQAANNQCGFNDVADQTNLAKPMLEP